MTLSLSIVIIAQFSKKFTLWSYNYDTFQAKIGQCEGVMGQIQLPPDTCVDYAYEMTTQTKETCANLIVGSMKKKILMSVYPKPR